MRWLFVPLLLMAAGVFAQNTFPSIGMWREHLPYHSALDVTASQKKIYCATPFSLFSVDLASGEVQRTSKVAGLSETGISTIKFDPVSKKLLVAYSNSNIDIIDETGIHNIPDLKRENTSGDKTIYDIFPNGKLWYLCTGLGVLVLNTDKLEVGDSWIIGDSGQYVKTYGFTRSDQFFYAATEEGLKKTPVNNTNPADFTSWQMVSGTNGLSAAACKTVTGFSGKIIALQNDSLFAENGSGWDLFFSNGWPIISATVSENRLFVCERRATGESQVVVLNADGAAQQTIRQPGVISFPQKAISVNNQVWIADLYGGLSRWTGNQYEAFGLNSPEDVSSGGMAVYNNILYATAGSVNDSWNYQYNRGGIFKLADESWTNYNQYHFPVLDSLMDFITVAVDPRDGSVWAGSFGGGLLHIKQNEQLEIFKHNSPLGQTIGDPGSYRVSGLAFDADQNLWISNFGSGRQLHVLKKDGTWQSFTVPFFLDQNATAQIVIDDQNQKWIVSPLGNGLIVLNDNNTIDNTADDQWKLYRAGAGQGNLPSTNVLCVAQDKSGLIWVGTSDGIAVIPCTGEVFTTGCEAVWPTIKEGNFANYLFKGQEVKNIAVDGADRKWIASSTGAWLISPDGDRIIEHFTEENSPLLSSDLRSIAVNGLTGEVFFATAKGISSFRGSATEAEETKSNVLVFPNPVPPSFRGNIGIRGLPDNSIVKITETNGRLVYQTRSLGGQAVWNGKDYKGRQVSSGIYLVMAEDATRQEKLVTKIVFISN